MYPQISRRIASTVLFATCAITFAATHIPLPHSVMLKGHQLVPHLDKFVHTGFYAVLAIVALITLRSWKFQWCWQLAAAVFLWLLAWGIFDELTQNLIAGRTADPTDLLADAFGAILGISMIAVMRWIGHSQPLAITSEDAS